MIRVSPDEKRPTHHVSLEDVHGNIIGLSIINDGGIIDPLGIAEAPVDRSAFKTFQGNQQYSDMVAPWASIAQSNWGGGGLSEDYDKDTTRFLWNRRTNPTLDGLLLGPRDIYTTGYRSMDFRLPGNLGWRLLTGNTNQIATSFVASSSYNARFLYLHIKRKGTPRDNLTIDIMSNAGGNPGTVLGTATITLLNIPDTEAEFHRVSIPAVSLVAGTTYWIRARSTLGDEDNGWRVGASFVTGSTRISADGATWALAGGYDLYFLVTDEMGTLSYRFFDYRYAKYIARWPAGGVPTIFINGDRGVAASNAGNLNFLVNAASRGWAVNEFVGAVVTVIEGPGFDEPDNFRRIIANDHKDLQVDRPWLIPHTASTAYVIVGANSWRPIAGHGLTGPITDILNINDILYFAMGESINIRRMRWTAAANAHEWVDDGTNRATKLTGVYDQTNGLTIWRGNNTAPISVSSMVGPPAWGTNLTFGTAITMRDEFGRINNMRPYGFPELPYLLREGTLMYVSAGRIIKVKIDEIATVMSSNNCIAATMFNVYLYFNLGASIQEYYNAEMNDVGYNREAGLPAGMAGIPVQMISYPGKIYIANDAGPNGISSIVVKYGRSLAELYRAPNVGQRISDISFQPVPGDAPDRLYAVVGNSIIWLCHPSNVNDPTKDPNYDFVHEGSLTTGFMYANMFDVDKLFNSIKIFSTGLIKDSVTVHVDYQLEDTNKWIPVKELFEDSPSQEVFLGEGGLGETAKRIRLRIVISTSNSKLGPRIKSSVVEAVYRISVKYSYTFASRMEDAEMDLRASSGPVNKFTDKSELIDHWSRGLIPLKMRSIYKKYDNKRVFIEPYPSRPTKTKSEAYYVRLLVMEL